MPDLARFARRFFLLRMLRASLVLGALYDLVFAVLMVAAPQVLADAFGLPLPGAAFYLWLLALLLAMLAVLYLIAARDPRRYSGIVAVAVGGRLAGAAMFALAAAREPAWAGLWAAAAVDAAFGLAHALLWRSIR